MREFETIFIVQPEISEEGRAAIVQRLEGVLEQTEGATRLELDDWGKRRLAYEIRKFQKGHYLSFAYGDDGAVVPEIERILRLDESVLRFLTVVVSEEIEDLEKRRSEAQERERIQREKAAERAREAEEARARETSAAQERSDDEPSDADESDRRGRRRDEEE